MDGEALPRAFGTAPSLHVQDTTRIMPGTPSVPIPRIATVRSSMVMLNLRLMGITARRQSVAPAGARFPPWNPCGMSGRRPAGTARRRRRSRYAHDSSFLRIDVAAGRSAAVLLGAA
jgi:hypothetical protein